MKFLVIFIIIKFLNTIVDFLLKNHQKESHLILKVIKRRGLDLEENQVYLHQERKNLKKVNMIKYVIHKNQHLKAFKKDKMTWNHHSKKNLKIGRYHLI